MVRSDGAMITEDNILSAPRIADIAKDIITSDHGFFLSINVMAKPCC
jgi:hypothetical protein